MAKTNVKKHKRRTKKGKVTVKKHKRKVTKRMTIQRMKKVTTPRGSAFYGIDVKQPSEEDYGFDVADIKHDAKTALTYKDTALGLKKPVSKQHQEEAMETYKEGQRILALKEIKPTEIVQLRRGSEAHLGVDEKGSKDWDKELEKKMDVPFLKKIVAPEDVKVEDVTKEFKGLTAREAHEKAYPPIELVSPEDKFIELTPAVYNKKGKKGDFQIKGQGPYGTLEEIKDQFPGKKLKIKWPYAEEVLD